MRRFALILMLTGCAALPLPDQVGGLPGTVDVPLTHGLTVSVESGELVRLLLTDARPRRQGCGAVLTWRGNF